MPKAISHIAADHQTNSNLRNVDEICKFFFANDHVRIKHYFFRAAVRKHTKQKPKLKN